MYGASTRFKALLRADARLHTYAHIYVYVHTHKALLRADACIHIGTHPCMCTHAKKKVCKALRFGETCSRIEMRSGRSADGAATLRRLVNEIELEIAACQVIV